MRPNEPNLIICHSNKSFLIFPIEFFGVCVFDNPTNRVLNGHFFSSNDMTVEMCLSTCREKDFRYSGMQWQIECYCENQTESGQQW